MELTGVGATALGVALLRARESARPDRIVEDPYAGHFARHLGDPWTADPHFLALMADQVAVRTRFFDDMLLAATHAGIDQVVLLACGVDTRAFRLGWPAATTVLELDLAEVLAFRDGVLAQQGATARCRRVEIAADLRGDWPTTLQVAGHDPDRPTAWLAEGILYALPPAAADLLIDRVTAASTPGSVLALDHVEDSARLRTARGALAAELVDLWQGGPDQDLAHWLTARGWATQVHDVAEIAARYGRPTPPEAAPARAWLVAAELGGR
ncbi:SAM-dependent methyltransferase [Actinophytocola gossypii]|uniref:S-adenosyl-L-methionine-dependent methyltransferase n=1 Tax=Actinophytocola gossypii TaxID=2812003 RepID=A0ABT2J8F5_9PSEU|nr:SAM-dependent methyltransferase [Actinophytocola gossypii]MCT2584137.1 SAM-dependent methyltransferase [Actinophytocola gossypii]